MDVAVITGSHLQRDLARSPVGGNGGATCCAAANPAWLMGLAGRWWVVHTRVRNEKVVAKTLAREGIPHYLPLVRLQRTYGGRRTTVSLPLFPGYLFMCGDGLAREKAWRTERVARVIAVADQDRLRWELQQIVHVVESGEPVNLFPGLREGRHCRITGGALKGLEGVVLRRRSVSRVYIGVTILGQSAVVEIDSALLESID